MQLGWSVHGHALSDVSGTFDSVPAFGMLRECSYLLAKTKGLHMQLV